MRKIFLTAVSLLILMTCIGCISAADVEGNDDGINAGAVMGDGMGHGNKHIVNGDSVLSDGSGSDESKHPLSGDGTGIPDGSDVIDNNPVPDGSDVIDNNSVPKNKSSNKDKNPFGKEDGTIVPDCSGIDADAVYDVSVVVDDNPDPSRCGFADSIKSKSCKAFNINFEDVEIRNSDLHIKDVKLRNPDLDLSDLNIDGSGLMIGDINIFDSLLDFENFDINITDLKFEYPQMVFFKLDAIQYISNMNPDYIECPNSTLCQGPMCDEDMFSLD